MALLAPIVVGFAIVIPRLAPVLPLGLLLAEGNQVKGIIGQPCFQVLVDKGDRGGVSRLEPTPENMAGL